MRPTAGDITQYVMDWQFGAGPLETLFRELDVEDIIINSISSTTPLAISPTPSHPAAQATPAILSETSSQSAFETPSRDQPTLEVWTYRQSGKRREDIQITADDLREIINRNAGSQGRALNPVNPILNAQMRNGARVNAVLSPVCDPYIAVTIRVHRLIARTFEDLVGLGTLSVPAAAWLWLVIRAGLSTVVGGGTGAGQDEPAQCPGERDARQSAVRRHRRHPRVDPAGERCVVSRHGAGGWQPAQRPAGHQPAHAGGQCAAHAPRPHSAG